MGSINLTNVNGTATINDGNPTGNKTFTLPTASGTLKTTSGTVLQVVSTTFSAQGSTTITTADTSTNPPITHSIVPLGTGSYFRIDVRWFGECTATWELLAHIYRNSARLNEGAGSTLNYHGLSMATQTYSGGDSGNTPEILTLVTLDKTGSTAGTAITYELKFSISYPSSQTLWTNRCIGVPAAYFESGISEIIITEIGA